MEWTDDDSIFISEWTVPLKPNFNKDDNWQPIRIDSTLRSSSIYCSRWHNCRALIINTMLLWIGVGAYIVIIFGLNWLFFITGSIYKRNWSRKICMMHRKHQSITLVRRLFCFKLIRKNYWRPMQTRLVILMF